MGRRCPISFCLLPFHRCFITPKRLISNVLNPGQRSRLPLKQLEPFVYTRESVLAIPTISWHTRCQTPHHCAVVDALSVQVPCVNLPHRRTRKLYWKV